MYKEDEIKSICFLVTAKQKEKLETKAKESSTTISEVLRALIDNMEIKE